MSEPDLIEDIFCAARAISSRDERDMYVRDACADDAELRQQVEELLQSDDQSNGPLDAPPPGISAGWSKLSKSVEPGTQIGPFKIREEIGEGGFGIVYVAEQEMPVRRKVALKLIKPGMDTKDVIARFEAERQALALMDHPNVAKVLDAGQSDQGRPYFVMELVHGVKITEFCDKNRLPTRQRLELFIDVCHAVQHAHQNGIIHRDLKPSNILVTLHDGRPVPKVIDFGVSKALSQQLTEKSIYTAYGQMIGTPEYMSPEQAEMSGLGVDTRSDIYALGVLLYELLTGSTPFDSARLRASGYDSMLRILREEEPPRPSTKVSTLGEAATAIAAHRGTDVGKLRKLLRGDLDWIVMKALEKDRNRRYETANGFRADIERYLKDEPVVARPPSTSYKLRKFARRNKGAIAAAAAVLLVLCLGLIGTSVGLVRADLARLDERRLNFRHAIDRGLALSDEGHVGSGMLWLAHALEIAPDDERALNRVVRANLNAWQRELHTLKIVFPQDEAITSVSYSPDGELILTGTVDGVAQLWDRTTARPRGKPMVHGGQVHEVPFSPDGSRFLTASYDNTARLWNATTGEHVRTFQHESSVYGALFASENRIITSTAKGWIRIWDVEDNAAPREEWQHVGHAVHDIALSPDGKQLVAACHDGIVMVWSLEDTPRPISRFDGHSARVASADFIAPNTIASGDTDGIVYLWRWTDAEGIAKGQTFGKPFRHNGCVHRLRVSRDGERILTASFDNDAQFLDSETGEPIGVPLENQGALYAVALINDRSGRALTACGDNYAREWQRAPRSLEQLFIHEVSSQPAIYTNDALYVVIKHVNGMATVHKALTGEQLGAPFRPRGGILALAVSSDESKMVTGSGEGTVQFWDTESGSALGEAFSHGAAAWAVSICDDGQRAYSAGLDGVVKSWDARTGKSLETLLNLGSDAIRGMALSHDGSQIAVATSTKQAIVLDATTGRIHRRLHGPQGHQDMVMRVAFSRDGNYLVTGGFDNIAIVWDLRSGLPVAAPMRHNGPIWYSVGFNSDATAIVTACDDHTARVWDVETGQPIGPKLMHEATLRAAAFTQNDAKLITGTAAGTTRIWDIAISPRTEDVEHIKLSLQVATGMQFDVESNDVRVLEPDVWQQRNDLFDGL